MAQKKSWAVVTVDGNITAASEDAEQWFGLKAGAALHRFIHINDQINWLSFLADLRNELMPGNVRLRLQQKNKARFALMVLSCRKQQDDGFLISIEDFEKDAVKPLHAVAHELRTPLNAIIGFADLMLHCPVDEEKARSYSQTIKKAGTHLLNVIETILHNAETNRGGYNISDAVQITRDSLIMLKPLQGEKNITFSFSDEKIMARIDETALRQIVFNLVTNALKFTDVYGKIHITLDETVDKKLRLMVADDGCGIQEEDMARITEPFVRSTSARQNKIQGNGLGLSLVRNLVQRFDGKLSFESQRQKGMKVTIILPLVELCNPGDGSVIDFSELHNISMNKTELYNDEETKTKKNRQTA